MWRRTNHPYQFSRPEDLEQVEAEDSAGYADQLGDGVQALAVFFVLSLCGFALWAHPDFALWVMP